MKPEIRTLGVDDGPFAFGDATVPVVGVVLRGATYVEGVLRTAVQVDGWDATDAVAAMVRGSRFHEGLRVILLDGAALGGFNVVDLDVLHETTGVPVVTVTRATPDRDAIAAALRAHHDDWRERLAVLDRTWPEPMENGGFDLAVRAVGIPRTEAHAILDLTTVRGAIPEPVRLAHLIASAFVRGESSGPA